MTWGSRCHRSPALLSLSLSHSVSLRCTASLSLPLSLLSPSISSLSFSLSLSLSCGDAGTSCACRSREPPLSPLLSSSSFSSFFLLLRRTGNLQKTKQRLKANEKKPKSREHLLRRVYLSQIDASFNHEDDDKVLALLCVRR